MLPLYFIVVNFCHCVESPLHTWNVTRLRQPRGWWIRQPWGWRHVRKSRNCFGVGHRRCRSRRSSNDGRGKSEIVSVIASIYTNISHVCCRRNPKSQKHSSTGCPLLVLEWERMQLAKWLKALAAARPAHPAVRRNEEASNGLHIFLWFYCKMFNSSRV